MWGTAIAIKTLKVEVFENKEEALEELQKEVEVLNQLRHPNVVLYMGVCLKQPHVCIVTEWCERGSLHDLIHDQEFTMDVYRMVGSVFFPKAFLSSLKHVCQKTGAICQGSRPRNELSPLFTAEDHTSGFKIPQRVGNERVAGEGCRFRLDVCQ